MGNEFKPFSDRLYWMPGRHRFRYAQTVEDWGALLRGVSLVANLGLFNVCAVRARCNRPPVAVSEVLPIGPAA